MSTVAQSYIQALGLQPHPEGGHYRETFRSRQNDGGGRSCATSILFLLTDENPSNFHRLDAEEIWFYHAGDPLTVHMIDEAGVYSLVSIGPDLDAGHSFQFVVPAGVWFGSSCDVAGGASLVGCVVAPGFSFEGFELAKREMLLNNYQDHHDIIKKLTRA